MSTLIPVLDSDSNAELSIVNDDGITLILSGPVVVNSAGTQAYRYVQATPSSTWSVNHNLGKNISAVSVFGNAGNQVSCDLEIVSQNTCVIRFVSNFVGYAHIN